MKKLNTEKKIYIKDITGKFTDISVDIVLKGRDGFFYGYIGSASALSRWNSVGKSPDIETPDIGNPTKKKKLFINVFRSIEGIYSTSVYLSAKDSEDSSIGRVGAAEVEVEEEG